MREWNGFEAPAGIKDHVIRYLSRDYALFARMNPGDQYLQAYEHAEEMFEEKLADLLRKGEKIQNGSTKWLAYQSPDPRRNYNQLPLLTSTKIDSRRRLEFSSEDQLLLGSYT